MMPCNTAVAIASVCLRSSGNPEVHTQRNGPNPKEKMSLKRRRRGYHRKKGLELRLFLPHDILDVRWVSKGRSLLLLTIFRRNISPSSSCFKKEGIAIVPEEQAYEKDTLFHPNVRYLEASMLTGLLRTFAARKA